jgi:hypothetical protein
MGHPQANFPGCVALKDGNTTCAAPLYRQIVCETDACNSVACLLGGPSAISACIDAARQGPCNMFNTVLAACHNDLVDGGSAAQNGPCSDITKLTYAICGNGS